MAWLTAEEELTADGRVQALLAIAVDFSAAGGGRRWTGLQLHW